MSLQYLSEQIVGADRVQRFKAPAGYMYEIMGVNFTSFSAVGNQFLIATRYVEEDRVTVNAEDAFFMADLAVDGATHSITFCGEGLKTKYISAGAVNDGNIQVMFTIFYKLVKASVKDLVLEFISRGKSP